MCILRATTEIRSVESKRINGQRLPGATEVRQVVYFRAIADLAAADV
jgi:hypothetical protein